jgi:hypothetical protein
MSIEPPVELQNGTSTTNKGKLVFLKHTELMGEFQPTSGRNSNDTSENELIGNLHNDLVLQTYYKGAAITRPTLELRS